MESGKEMKLTLHIKPQCEFGKGACRYTIVKDIKEAEGEEDIVIMYLIGHNMHLTAYNPANFNQV